MNVPSILVVDDYVNTRAYLRALLEHEGFGVLEAGTGERAFEVLSSRDGRSIRAILLDLKLPNQSGIDLIAPFRSLCPRAPIIIMTAHASVPTAVSAIQKGAFHYLEKPLSEEELLETLSRALSVEAPEESAGTGVPSPLDLVGATMEKMMDRLQKAGSHAFPVLITGESGTGKEMVARTIHRFSARSREPFVAVNTGAIPRDLVSSELFGHEKGAFTGAQERKIGWFEAAGNGTLFLDEIGTMDLPVQVALLRVIEGRNFSRVGGTVSIPFSARILCATNENLEDMMREGRFREDLFYRLNVHSIRLPPLRQRTEEIGFLASHFLQEALGLTGEVPEIRFTEGARKALERYPWPGNIRELKNCMITVSIEHGYEIRESSPSLIPEDWLPESVLQSGALHESFEPEPRTLKENERDQIRKILLETGGNKAQAARILGISRKSLYAKLREYGLGESSGPVKDDPGPE